MKVRVRVVFPRPGAMLASGRKDSYFAGLWPHLGADRSGLAGLPTPDRPLDFVLFEDFGTRGLPGPPEQSEDEEIDAGRSRTARTLSNRASLAYYANIQ